MTLFGDLYSSRFSLRRTNKKSHRPDGLSRQRKLLSLEALESRRVLAAAVPTSLAVYTPSQSFVAGTASGIIKVQLLDQFAHAIKAPAGGETIDLSSSSGTGVFLNQQGTAPIPGNKITIAAGTSAASFRYTDTHAGAPVITLASDPVNPTVLNPTAQSEYVKAATATQVIFVDQSVPPKPLPAAPPTIITAGAFNPISLELLDPYGNVAVAAASSTVVKVQKTPHGPTKYIVYGNTVGQEMALSSDSPTGVFFATAGPTTPITTVTIPKGQSVVTVYYEDPTSGIIANLSATTAKLGSATRQFQTTNAPSQVVFSDPGSPGSAVNPALTFTAGMTQTVHVQMEDVGGLLAASAAGGTITIVSPSATGILSNFKFGGAPPPPGVNISGNSGTITITVAAGVPISMFSFDYTDTTAGTFTFTAGATLGGVMLQQGSQTDAVVADTTPAQVHVAYVPPVVTTASVNIASDPITIQLQDHFGNVVTAGIGGVNVALSSTSVTGTFQKAGSAGNITSIVIAQNASTAMFTYTDSTAGTPTITATPAGGVASSQQIAVSGIPTQIVVSTSNLAPFTAGSISAPVTVTLEDSSNNPANATQDVTITLNSSNSSTGTFQVSGTPGTNVTTLTIPKGSHSATFTYSDTMASTPTLTVNDTTDGLPSKTVAATVTAGAATTLAFTSTTGGTVNTNTPVTVSFEFLDANNNVTTAPGGITITPTDFIQGTNTSGGGTFGAIDLATGTFTYQNANANTYSIFLSSTNPTLNPTASPFTITVATNSATAPAFQNPNFSAGSIQNVPPSIPSWNWNSVGTTGVTAAGGSQFAVAPPAPSNGQAAFLTGGAALSQDLNFTATGTFTLTFRAIKASPASGITVSLDGNAVQAIPAASISSSSWTLVTISVPVATTGSHTIQFLGNDSGGTVSFTDITFS